MRRAVIFLILLAIAVGITFTIYSAYCYHEEVLLHGDLLSKERRIDENGAFVGKFYCQKPGRVICDYEYVIEEGNLYITIFATAGDKKALEVDEEKYVTIRIENVGDVEKVYYRTSKKDNKLDLETE